MKKPKGWDNVIQKHGCSWFSIIDIDQPMRDEDHSPLWVLLDVQPFKIIAMEYLLNVNFEALLIGIGLF